MIETSSYRISCQTTLSRWSIRAFFLLAALFLIAPLWADKAALELMTLMFIYVVLAQCWNLLSGYGGLISAGQHAFVGIGGYVLFMLVLSGGNEQSFLGAYIPAGINPLWALPVAGLVAMLIALPAALLLFRLHGAYFAIGSWVIADVCRLSFAQIQSLGGGSGLSLTASVARSTYGIAWLKETFGIKTSLARTIVTYELATWLMLAVLFVAYLLLRSAWGLKLAAVRDNERTAESIGIDRTRVKYVVYLFTAFVTGVLGALIFLVKLRISPDSAFSLQDWTAYTIFIVVIGGLGTLEGPLVGVFLYFLLREFLADHATLYLIILGCSAMVFMIYAPKGIWGLIAERWNIALFPLRWHVEVRKTDRTT